MTTQRIKIVKQQKVELSQVEHEAFLEYKRLLGSNSSDMQFALYNYINRNYRWSDEIKPLYDMGLEKFVSAWYGYDVENKAEKERVLWETIGRAPGEIKTGDAIRTTDREIYYVNDELIVVNDVYADDVTNWLAEGTVIGIYPVETYLSLGVE